MKKILQYFTSTQEQSLFEKQKTNAFLLIIFSILFIALIIMIKSFITGVGVFSSLVMTSLLVLFMGLNLGILKKTSIKIAGNFYSLGTVLLVVLSIYIQREEIIKLDMFAKGYYLIIAVYSVGILFASRKFLILNFIIIFITTAIIYLLVLEQNLEQKILLQSLYQTYAVTLIVISLIYYFANKFTENAINEAKKDAETIKKQNIELKKHQENLELLVAERTSELETTNEELKASNEELYNKTEIIENQNIKLNATLYDLKETQSNLLHAEKMASLGILTAGVAHEINNPLNYIMGSYVGLEKYFRKNEIHDKNVEMLLNGLKTGVNRAADIVKGLNQFSRSNDDFTEHCDIHYIINNCLLILNNQLKNRIEISKNFRDEKNIILGNMGKLHQVFVNIFTNSIQAIENDGAISIISQKKEKSIAIEISDTGSGISKDDISKIMDPFFTTKDPGKGTGLGLSITYSIIKEHKGDIKYYSEDNKGTRVIITLPLKS